MNLSAKLDNLIEFMSDDEFKARFGLSPDELRKRIGLRRTKEDEGVAPAVKSAIGYGGTLLAGGALGAIGGQLGKEAYTLAKRAGMKRALSAKLNDLIQFYTADNLIRGAIQVVRKP